MKMSKEEQKNKKDERINKQQMADLNSIVSTITLKLSGLNTLKGRDCQRG